MVSPVEPSNHQTHSPISSLQFPSFRFYLSQRFLAIAVHLMMMIAVGQYVYELTHSPFHLGYVGLVLFLPKFCLAIFTGHVADRYDRKRIILVCRVLQTLVMVSLAVVVFGGGALFLIYLLLLVMGTAYAFEGPAGQALLPQLVPPEHFGNAVTWNATLFQFGFVLGPLLGGWLYALIGGAGPTFLVIALLRAMATVLVLPIHPAPVKREERELSLKTLLAGIHYIREKRVILGTISLDLFAVLLGGAVGLMPIFANDILQVGPAGLGALRAAPAVGAAFFAILLAHLPPLKKAGMTMLWSVVFFGIFTILFGLSQNFVFSLLCLFILGAADMVSVIIRGVLVQIETPPEMRGRVSAINLVFIGASNELGEFESGVTAGWFGTVPAVVIGGIGTLVVVALWAWRFPEIRGYKSLEAKGEIPTT